MKIKTWDGNNINDTTNYLSVLLQDAYGLPDAGVRTAPREGAWPLVTGLDRPGHAFTIEVYVTGSSVATLQKQIYQWFDPEDETPKKLVVEDSTGGGDRYVYAICKRIRSTGPTYALHFLIDLVVHGDIRWRENTATTDTWTTTDTGLTKTLTNNGEDDAYPVITVTPLAGRTSGYTYRRFVAVDWVSPTSGVDYPVDIGDGGLDTAALVSGGKMQADGDDLRVYVDGIEVPRWLDGMNSTDTAVWVNFDFTYTWLTTKSRKLLTAIGATDTVTTIDVNTVLTWSSAGYAKINSELFSYTGKTSTSLTGVTRAIYGTSAAAHATTDDVIWIEHEVFIVYGDGTATAPSTDNDIYKPMFTLASSSNTVWDYDEFYESGVPTRTAAWEESHTNGVTMYGANHGGSTDNPYTELGIKVIGSASEYRYGTWSLAARTVGTASVNFANGEKYSETIGTAWDAEITDHSSPYDIYDIPEPTTDATWESWSHSGATNGGYIVYFSLAIDKSAVGVHGKTYYVEVADVTITLDSDDTPTIMICSESGSYTLDCRITNSTTGDYIDLYIPGMDTNQSIEIDTNDKTVTYSYDGSSQYQALELPSGPRKDWLKLQPGDNVIKYDETGATGVRLDFSWDERHYD